MGIFDDLLKKAGSQVKTAARSAADKTAADLNSAVSEAAQKASERLKGSVDKAVGKTAKSVAYGKNVFGQYAQHAALANQLQGNGEGEAPLGQDGSDGWDGADLQEGPVDEGTGHGYQTFTFSNIPQNLDEMRAMPESELSTPFCAAALTVLAFCRWGESKEDCFAMLNFLRGPRPVSEFDKQFIRDRLTGREYLPFSYFEGTSPENDYTPPQPYKITVSENPYSYRDDGYCRLDIRSSGADSPRQVTLRCQGGKVWRLWENTLLPMIREPQSSDPWA